MYLLMEKGSLLFIGISLVLGLSLFFLAFAQYEETFALSEKDIKDALILSKKDTTLILGVAQSETSKLVPNGRIFAYSSRGQAALTLFRSSSRKAVLDFLPGFAATETVKVVIKAASSFQKLSTVTAKEVLEEIEKQTVQKAVETGVNWLFQNKIKIGSGSITKTYRNYEGVQTEAIFQYVVAYESIDSESAKAMVEFYSPDFVDAPEAKSSISGFIGFVGDSPHSGTVDPFVIHLETQVTKSALGWVVDSSARTKITVEFPDEVPRLELTKELPYPIEEQKINLLNKLTAIKKVFDTLGNAGIEIFNILSKGVGMVQGTAEDFFSFISKVISLGGAGLVDPAVESQLNEIKEELDVKENQAQLSLTKDEGDEPFLQPQSEVNQVELSETKEDLKLQENQEGEEKLSLVKEICVINPLKSPVFGGVILSEIAWMGTVASANDEWIRLQNVSHLQNISNVSVNLQGWQLIDKNGDIEVIFEQDHLISSRGAFLLERTDDTSLPSVSADFIYTGVLNNTNEALYLFDSNCVLRDKVEASPNWPGGDNDIKQPMVRLSDLSWEQAKLDLVKDEEVQERVFAGCLDGQININAVNNDLLQEIVQIGDVTAEQIIEARVLQAFYTIDELERISGIAERTVAKIKEQGWACAADAKDVSFRSFQKPVSYGGGGGGSSGSQSSQENQSEEAQLCSQANIGSPSNTPVIINEIAWMGTTNSANDEWIELKNVSEEEVTLEGWQLLDASGQIEVIFTNQDIIAASGFYILERTDDTTLLGITADTIYVGSLGNSDESLRLFDNTCTLIDEIIADPDWPGGDNDTKYTLERAEDLSWQTHYGEDNSGTPGAENSTAPEDPPTPVVLPQTVVINEVAWMGTIASANEEWLELYNTTAADVDLIGWKLQAEDSAPTIELIGTIAANSYFLLERTDDTTISDIAADQIYTGALENEGEILKLYDAENNLIDIVDASAGWIAGDNAVKQSMERIDAAKGGSDPPNWANNNLITHNGEDSDGGYVNSTPRAQNSVSYSSTTIINTAFLRFNEFEEVTLAFLGSPYEMLGNIEVPPGKTLIVEPGVTIRLKALKSHVIIHGTLQAVGSEDNVITFIDGADGNFGNWCGFSFSSTSTNSQLEYVKVEQSASVTPTCGTLGGKTYALFVDGTDIIMKNSVINKGSSDHKLSLRNSNSTIDSLTITGDTTKTAFAAGIYIEGGSPSITNSTIKDSAIGIFVENNVSDPASLPTITNNTLTDNTYAIILAGADAVVSGNTATGNTYNGIWVKDAISTANAVWEADTIPYIVNQLEIEAGKTLTIQSGVVVKFLAAPLSNTEFIVHGTLLVQGTAANQVVFTRIGDDTVGGDTNGEGLSSTVYWKRMRFTSTSTGSVLNHTVLKYGGHAAVKYIGETEGDGALHVQGEVDLQNVTVQDSPRVGLYSSGIITGSGITLVDNAYGLNLVMAECPVLTNVTISGSGEDFYPGSLECQF